MKIRIRKGLSRFLALLDGEWLLWFLPNGGGVIFLRALLVAGVLFCASVGLESWIDRGFSGSWPFLLEHARERLPWFGALFGASYAALYARFSAQWSYLAGLYNQLMSAENSAPRLLLTGEKRRRRTLWWVAFIEDAIDLHLATKRSYAFVIAYLLAEPRIRQEFIDSDETDPERINRLESRIRKATDRELPNRIDDTAAPPPMPTSVEAWLEAVVGDPQTASAAEFEEWMRSENGRTVVGAAITRLKA